MPVIKSTSYSIHIGNKSLSALYSFLKKANYSKYYIICDEHTFENCLSTLLFACPILNEAEIIELESGEEQKTLETCAQVWGALTETGADKKSLIINLGGGVITDLGGFVASTFKRGIHFINVPTTLLAMVDASVGGKTGVDFNGIKNHIGTTCEPKAVFIDPAFLETLGGRQIKNGYAEVIKIALIADAGLWTQLRTLTNESDFYSEQIITNAVELKNAIVKKDLHEKNLRKSLNFGHNIGHALESSLIAQQKDILHGEAVAAGVVMEAFISEKLKRISLKEFSAIEKYISKLYGKVRISKKTEEQIMQFISHDKKNENGKLCFALPKGIGSYELYEDVNADLITKAIAAYN